MIAEPEPPQEAAMDWYRPSQDLVAFHQSCAFVRMLIGGRGAGKTASVVVEAIRHCWRNAGAKVIFARKTETSQVGSTIDTLLWCFNQMGDLYDPTKSYGLFRSWNDGLTFRVPSRLAVARIEEAKVTHSDRDLRTWTETIGKKYCGEIQMKGLPHVSAGDSKLRGMECSMMVFIEGDQIEERAFSLSFACLRWKGADRQKCDRLGFIRDRSIILDTNPPSPQHWIAMREAAEETKGKDSPMRFWHLKTDDNAHNLPPNYIRDTIMLPYENNPAMIERMRYGRYADAFDGKPVFYAYRPGLHEGENLPWPLGAYLVRSYDQGNPNATIFSAYWVEGGIEYWHDLHEIVLPDSDADRQSLQALHITQEEFPFWNDRAVCSGVLDFCDPAYASTSGTTKIEVNKERVDMSQLAVFNRNGIWPGMRTHARGLQETIAIVNRLLTKRDAKGAPCYRIDIKGCPQLRRAMAGGYRYPSVGEPGFGKNEPLKGPLCEGLDAVADAARYGKINCLRLLQTEMERPNKPTPWNMSKPKPANMRRRI